MAKRVIVLGMAPNGAGQQINYVCWYPITSGAKTQTAGSQWTGASAAENTAIQAGAVMEEGNSDFFPNGTTATSIKDYVLNKWATRNTQINGVGPATYSGIFNDSVTGWSA